MLKFLLFLSHGQFQVERFLYRNVASTYMVEESMIACNRGCGGIHNWEIPMEQCITLEKLKSCRFADSRYMTYIEDNKNSKQANKGDRKTVGEELNLV